MMRLNLFLKSNSNINKIQAQAFLQRSFSTNKSNSITTSSSSSSSSSSSDSSSDDEQKKGFDKQKSVEAREKLNLLLNRMIQEDAVSKKYPKLELAKPKNQREKDVRTEPGTKSIKKEPVEQQVVKAVKAVAKSVGGDVKQTESELLQKLLSAEETQQTTATNLSDLFKDMKIDRETKATEQVSRAHQVRQLIQTVKPARSKISTKKTSQYPRKQQSQDDMMDERVDLFGSDRLGIFPSREEVDKWENPELNKTWKSLYERELRLTVTHPPANYFQQVILWTEQKKLWRFPIDNEQDLEKEKKVYFTEHVFLEKHLEPWCPPKGPLRHFMELVCVGLSKNYYLTVEQKKEHIEWFRNYFVEKKKVLTEVGAIPANFKIDEDVKKIEG
ncbi:hypothetical protein ILUMI_19039 [Ignelater luminosus]|uniref:Small ribosomal subunit protein mS31 n=1 Tax=Ignelater luminosus TaxID=2038154 RepID=A0A8K0CH18_IGNLU|nr:hypothetical protein ILUMI_19039 [Ignelater luminosus]